MLAEIENAVIARLKAKAPKLVHLPNPLGTAVQPAQPAYCMGINRGPARREGQARRQTAVITLWLAFKNLQNELERRHGVYPLIEALAQLLDKQALGMDIQPLKYAGFQNVTDEDDRAGGLTVYQIDFETAYNIEELDEEGAVNLLTIALNYLVNGATTATATDVVKPQE